MRVSVLGAGSRLGQVVVGKLIAAGHEVTAVGDQHTLDLTRDLTASKARAVTETQLRLALRATQAVVNLLPLVDGPPPSWFTTRRRRRARHSRMSILDNALAAAPAGVRWVHRSSASVYPDAGHTWIGEDLPTHPHRLTNEVLYAESASRTDTHSEDAVLRLGHLWGVADIPTINWLRAAGNGWDVLELPEDAYWPMLELSDAADAFCRALTAAPGTYNVADANPLTAADITNLLVAAFGRRKLHPSGGLIFPRDAHLYYRSHRLDSSRFALASGWAPACGPFPIALAERAAQLLDVPHRLRLRLEVPW